MQGGGARRNGPTAPDAAPDALRGLVAQFLCGRARIRAWSKPDYGPQNPCARWPSSAGLRVDHVNPLGAASNLMGARSAAREGVLGWSMHDTRSCAARLGTLRRRLRPSGSDCAHTHGPLPKRARGVTWRSVRCHVHDHLRHDDPPRQRQLVKRRIELLSFVARAFGILPDIPPQSTSEREFHDEGTSFWTRPSTTWE